MFPSQRNVIKRPGGLFSALRALMPRRCQLEACEIAWGSAEGARLNILAFVLEGDVSSLVVMAVRPASPRSCARTPR